MLGSLSSAVLTSKLLKLPDPRTHGSQNPGATNVLRVSGKLPAIITLLGDVLKGFIPVLFAHLVGVTDFSIALVALAAVLGHIFPIFFEFRGGKGVATALGAFIAINSWIGVLAIVAWLIVTAVTRYVSLASLVAIWLAVFYTMVLIGYSTAFPAILIGSVVTWKHWTNIQRLREGTENKIKIINK